MADIRGPQAPGFMAPASFFPAELLKIDQILSVSTESAERIQFHKLATGSLSAYLALLGSGGNMGKKLFWLLSLSVSPTDIVVDF